MIEILIARIIVIAAGVYIGVGILFALFFVISPITRVDPAAKGTNIGFRALIFFGAVPFWPLLAARVWGPGREPVESNSHRNAAAGRDDD